MIGKPLLHVLYQQWHDVVIKFLCVEDIEFVYLRHAANLGMARSFKDITDSVVDIFERLGKMSAIDPHDARNVINSVR